MPFRMQNLMTGIVGDSVRLLNLELHDGGSDREGDLLCRIGGRPVSPAREWRSARRVEVAGRLWTLTASPRPELFTSLGATNQWVILAAGLGSSAVIYFLFAFLARAERHTLAVADERKEKLQLLLDATGEAISGLDLQGRCTFCNQACLRLLGYERPEQLLGRNMHDLLHHSTEDGILIPHENCSVFQAFRTGKAAHVEGKVMSRTDGTSFPSEYWSTPQRHDGEVVGAPVTFLDISKRRRTEAEVRRQGALIRSLRVAKSAFLATMSHEVRTPMNGVIGMIGLLIDTELDVTQRSFARSARSSGDLLLSVIDDILDLSKIEACKLDLDEVDFDLGKLLDELVTTVTLQAGEKGLALRCVLLPQTPSSFRGDGRRLRQVLVTSSATRSSSPPPERSRSRWRPGRRPRRKRRCGSR